MRARVHTYVRACAFVRARVCVCVFVSPLFSKYRPPCVCVNDVSVAERHAATSMFGRE